MKSKRIKIVPDVDDWRPDHEQPKPTKKSTKKCNRIQECPEPGCGKPGCMTRWLEKDKDNNLTGFVVYVVLHAHNLYRTFEQRRNYNHVVRDHGDEKLRVRFHPDDIRRSVTLKNARQLPDFVLDKFGVNVQ